MQEFKVNQYITLKLEKNKTDIYINGKRFNQCKILLLNIPIKKYERIDTIESVDEAAEKLLKKKYKGEEPREINLDPKTEFWGHCSNIQFWVENKYNTKFLHRSLAFPLLRKLAELGEPSAKIIFKEEIIKRLKSGHLPVIFFLIEEGYLSLLKEDDFKYLGSNYFIQFFRNTLKLLNKVVVPCLDDKPIFIDYSNNNSLREIIQNRTSLWHKIYQDYDIALQSKEKDYLKVYLFLDGFLNTFSNNQLLALFNNLTPQQVADIIIHLKNYFGNGYIPEEPESSYIKLGAYGIDILLILMSNPIEYFAEADSYGGLFNKFKKLGYSSLIDQKLENFLSKSKLENEFHSENYLFYCALSGLIPILSENTIFNLLKNPESKLILNMNKTIEDEWIIKRLFQIIDKHTSQPLKELLLKCIPKNELEVLNEISNRIKKDFDIKYTVDPIKKPYIFINGNHRIGELNLYNCNLKSLPSSLDLLSDLVTLKLTCNSLTTLPKSVGNLNNLQKLYLEVNDLSSLPESIYNFKNLKELYLDWNKKLILTESIENLQSLEILSIYGIDDISIPTSIVNLKNLKKLYISEVKFESLPKELIKNNLTKIKKKRNFRRQMYKDYKPHYL